MSLKCQNCKLTNFPGAERCARCDSGLVDIARSQSVSAERPNMTQYLIKRTVFIIGVIVITTIGFYASLIASSKALSIDERVRVEKAIDLLEQRGFYDEVFYLRKFAVFRGSDNWLNSLVPKENAYAATNYPFEIVTLYSDFFLYAEDKVERAAILLHEAKHLQGQDEKSAYEFVWKHRQQLGWTKDKYRRSVLWLNTRKQTKEYVPKIFICEFNEYHDCTAR